MAQSNGMPIKETLAEIEKILKENEHSGKIHLEVNLQKGMVPEVNFYVNSRIVKIEI